MPQDLNLKFQCILDYLHDETYVFQGHRHRYFEVNIVLSGVLEVVYDNYVLLLKENDFFLGEPFIFHRSKCMPGQPVHLLVVEFESTDISLTGGPSMFRLSAENRALLEVMLQELKLADFQMDQQNIPPLAAELFQILLYRLLREEKKLRFSKSRDSEIYNTAVLYMKQHLNQNMTTKQLAQQCGVCATTLKNTFRRCAGLGVGRFFTELKIDEARRLLEQYSACDVSERLGFSSQGYFSAVFKSVTGKTPREYRALQQKNSV